MVDAWKELNKKYELDEVAPNTYILNDENSDNLREAFKHADVKF